jgi:protein involved in polysaccharide export with SLBB domain
VRVEGEVNKPGVYPVLPGDTLASILKKAGGTTADAYLYGMGFYREDVKKAQRENLDKLLRRLESESAGSLAQVSQSFGASSDLTVAASKVQALQLAQRQSLERARSLKPEGRIALGLPAALNAAIDLLPDLRLQNGDRIYLPTRPDFVYVYGSVNTESALLFKRGSTVADYLELAGSNSGADRDAVILIRADGSALTSQGFWRNDLLGAQVMPGDTIVMPEKLDRESGWSSFIRNTKDITQVFYQLGLGAAAIKTLRQ